VRYKTPWQAQNTEDGSREQANNDNTLWFGLTPNILRVGLITLLFYFSVFLIRPFFTQFWQSQQNDPWLASELMSSFIYAIPAWIALFGLWINHKQKNDVNHYRSIMQSLFIGVIGLWVQAQPDSMAIILGRIIFAWALFQVSVRLEILLFEKSSPERYGQDFSKVHFMQNLGIIASSFTVGHVVNTQGFSWTFYLAMSGLMITLLLFYVCFKQPNSSGLDVQSQPENS
ncbi:MAG: hypothetical protein NXI00_24590, partial [Cytophagales bacterium]|nr:hypothetical protein [Cytophagales bacterium]